MNFTILTLTTMFVMGYAASLCKTDDKQLLDDILQSVSSLEKWVNKSSNPKVKVTSDSPQTCVKGFFCLAEKALEDANLSANVPDAEKLIRQLNQLNKNVTNCTLSTTDKHPLGNLLKDIRKCTVHRRREKPPMCLNYLE